MSPNSALLHTRWHTLLLRLLVVQIVLVLVDHLAEGPLRPFASATFFGSLGTIRRSRYFATPIKAIQWRNEA